MKTAPTINKRNRAFVATSMNNNRLLIVLIVLVVLNIVVVSMLVFRGNGPSINAALTQPVKSVYGTVRSIGSSSFTMNLSGDADRVVTVEVPDSATITKQPEPMFDATQQPVPQGTTTLKGVSSLQQGDSVLVNSLEDIRFVKGTTITAGAITIAQRTIQMSGVIQEVSSTAVKIKGGLSPTFVGTTDIQPQQEQIITARLTGSTKITETSLAPVTLGAAPSPPRELTRSALTPRKPVSAYLTKQDGEYILVSVMLMPTPQVSPAEPLKTATGGAQLRSTPTLTPLPTAGSQPSLMPTSRPQ